MGDAEIEGRTVLLWQHRFSPNIADEPDIFGGNTNLVAQKTPQSRSSDREGASVPLTEKARARVFLLIVQQIKSALCGVLTSDHKPHLQFRLLHNSPPSSYLIVPMDLRIAVNFPGITNPLSTKSK